jgi:hypothetical protein
LKKNIFFLFIFFALTSQIVAQEKSNAVSKPNNPNLYTSLKPNDVQPAVFSSQAELNAKIQDKKDKIQALIAANVNDSVKLKYYREELWRFENAIVK